MFVISYHASTNSQNRLSSRRYTPPSSTVDPSAKKNSHSKRLAFLHKFDAKQARELGEFRRMQLIARQKVSTPQEKPATTSTSTSPAASSSTGTTSAAKQSLPPSTNPASTSTQSNAPVTPPTTVKEVSTTNSILDKPPLLVPPVATPVGNSSTPAIQTGSTTPLVASPPPAASTPVAPITSIPTALEANQTLPTSLSTSQSVAANQIAEAPKKGLSAAQTIPLIAGIVIGVVIVGWCIAWFRKRARDRQHGVRKVEKVNIKGPFQKQEQSSSGDSEAVFTRLTTKKRVAFESLSITNEKLSNFGTVDSLVTSPVHPRPPAPPPPASLSRSPTLVPTPASILAYDKPAYTPQILTHPSPPSVNPLLIDDRVKGSQMEGKVFLVERTYQAVLADELVISVGERLEVLISYDDGWCLGRRLDAGPDENEESTKGVFPRDCAGARPIAERSASPSARPLDSRASLASAARRHPPTRSDFRVISSRPSISPLNSSIFDQFPAPPGSGPQRAQGQQRVSSLCVARSTQLFLEIGNALGESLHAHPHPR